MVVVDRLQGINTLSEQGLRDLGELSRTEAERLARMDPSLLKPLLKAVRTAGQCQRSFLPWAQWVEGIAEQLRGRPKVAVDLLRDASQWFRRRGDAGTAARVDLALMDALASLGRYRDAMARGKRALQEFTSRGDRQRSVSALVNLGGISELRDQVRDALRYWQRARRLVSKEDRLRQAAIDANLAVGAHAMGRFHQAVALYSSSVRLYNEHGATASALARRLGVAEVRTLMGEIGQAMQEIKEIEQLATGLEDYTTLFEARLLLCRIELDLGHYRQAREIAAASQPVCIQQGRLDDAARFAMLAALAAAREPDPGAKELIETAEQALRSTGLGLTAATMRIELTGAAWSVPLSQLLRDAGRLDRAGVTVQADLARVRCAAVALDNGQQTRASKLCEEVLRRRHLSVWPRIEAHCTLAEISLAEVPAAAIRHFRQAVRLAESVRGRLSSEQDRRAVTARTSTAYERLVELLLSRGDCRSRRQAFELVARVKSRSLIESLDRRRETEWHDSPELVQRWNKMRQELGGMLSAIEGRSGEGSRYSTAVVKQRIREISHQMKTIELTMARSEPAIGAALGYLQAPRLRTVLNPGELYLELFFTGSDLVVFELDSSRLRVTTKAGARQRIEQLVRSVQFQLSKAAYGRQHLEQAGNALVAQVCSDLGKLGSLLLGCLRHRQPPKSIFLAPHGVLHHIPFAALELEQRPLLEICPVAVVPGSAVLAHLLQQPHRRPRRLGIAGAAQAELAEINREVAEMARRFPEAESVPGAAIDEVCSLLRSCDAVHIASHGTFQPLFPAGSGIRLGDGWLTALDLLRAPISASFVSLGACASGQVAVHPGEELDGVVRALLASGVHTAILAPGALDDYIARIVAGELYEKVLTDGPGQALRNALLTVRQHHPHPALWAALQLYGNPRPWEEEL